MISRKFSMAAAVAMTLALPLASSGVEQDPLRCDAARLRWDARQMDCVARCQNRAEVRMARRGGETGTEQKIARVYLRLYRCERSCANRHDRAMQRLARRPVCMAPAMVQPNPQCCEADLLREEARNLTCQSRCQGRATRWANFNLADCQDRCTKRYDENVANILLTPECEGFEQTE